MDQQEPDILELLIEHELALKRLYEAFALDFADRRDLWLSLARDEQGHALVAEEIGRLKAAYHFGNILADQWSIDSIRQSFAERGLGVEEKTFSSKSKAAMYSRLKAELSQGKVELLDHRESIAELRALECRLTSGGNMQIGHPERGGHDDYADVIALLVDACSVQVEAAAYLPERASLEERQSECFRNRFSFHNCRLEKV